MALNDLASRHPGTCSVPVCDLPVAWKGKCESHYRYGHSTPVRRRFKDRPEYAEAERLLGLGLTFAEVAKLCNVDRETISRNFPDVPRRVHTGTRAGRYWELLPLVQANASLNEIRRTIGMDYRTVRSYFPHYAPFKVGGGGRAEMIRQVNQDLSRIDEHGNISTRRHRE